MIEKSFVQISSGLMEGNASVRAAAMKELLNFYLSTIYREGAISIERLPGPEGGLCIKFFEMKDIRRTNTESCATIAI